jgi:hypothetical protein
MDPIHPITPGTPPVQRARSMPVERLERVSRERDRPSHDAEGRGRRERERFERAPEEEDDDGLPHIDVRA